MVALQLNNPKLIPDGYTKYILCKLFGCLPSELDAEDAQTMAIYLGFYNAEQKDAEIRRKAHNP